MSDWGVRLEPSRGYSDLALPDELVKVGRTADAFSGRPDGVVTLSEAIAYRDHLRESEGAIADQSAAVAAAEALVSSLQPIEGYAQRRKAWVSTIAQGEIEAAVRQLADDGDFSEQDAAAVTAQIDARLGPLNVDTYEARVLRPELHAFAKRRGDEVARKASNLHASAALMGLTAPTTQRTRDRLSGFGADTARAIVGSSRDDDAIAANILGRLRSGDPGERARGNLILRTFMTKECRNSEESGTLRAVNIAVAIADKLKDDELRTLLEPTTHYAMVFNLFQARVTPAYYRRCSSVPEPPSGRPGHSDSFQDTIWFSSDASALWLQGRLATVKRLLAVTPAGMKYDWTNDVPKVKHDDL